MTASTYNPVPPLPPETIINGDEWYKVVIALNRSVQTLCPLLGCEQTIPYIDEWNETFSSMTDLIHDFPAATYEDAAMFLFGDTPSTFLQF